MTTTSPDPTDPADPAALVAALDLEAKVRLLTGATAFTLAPEPAIGLTELRMSDGPTGVRGLTFSGGRVVALVPNATLLASAWSEDTAHEVGGLLAEEAMAQRIHVVLGPTVNLHRSALGGRLFEAYSEDPLLSGRLAAAYVRGLQERGVGACVKHLVANESETDRTTADSVVDEATLRELYLLPFEIAVAEAHPWSVMAAYNDVNGVPATEQHHVVNEVLKDEWGWDGVVVSDWSATRSAGPAAAGGLDLVMPGPHGPWGDALVAAVRAGEVGEAVVDDHLRRLLLLARRVGALDGAERSWPEDLPAPDAPVRREQLRRLAAQGMTVLTNGPDGDPVLPLRRGSRVALIGRHALETVGMGGGSAQVNPPYQVSVADGLRAVLDGAPAVADGVDVRLRPLPARRDAVTDPVSGGPGVRVTLVDQDGRVVEDRAGAPSEVVVGIDDEFEQHVGSIRMRARIAGSGRVEVGVIGAGWWHLALHPVDGGADGDEGVADDIAHDLELRAAGGIGGELLAPPAQTWDVDLDGEAVLEAVVALAPGGPFGRPWGRFGLVARPAPRPLDEVLADAVAACEGADVAVVVAGLTDEQETESVDKSTLALPGDQDALVSAVAAAAPRTVVVVNAATPVLMPWLGEVDAVLWAGLPGQEAGHAVAAALLGDIEPAGRLVTTFPVSDGAAPAWSVTPVDGRLPYDEGTHVGYRGHHAGLAPAPAFWLGHGLGYASWEYGAARVARDDPSPVVAVTVRNTSARDGREVVQVYLDPDDEGQPVRLVGWTAVQVGAGESAEVEVATDDRLWRRWDEGTGGWARLSGRGRLLVARGLGDVRATLPLG